MGADKRLLEMEGRPQFLRAWEAARGLAERVMVLAPEGDLPLLRGLFASPIPESSLGRGRPRPYRSETKGDETRAGVEWVADPQPGAGPLQAVSGALEKVDSQWVCLLAVDYPQLSPADLVTLGALARKGLPKGGAWIPVVAGRPQYLCAFYERSVGASMRSAVDSGCRSFRGWLEEAAIPVAWADESFWGKQIDARAFVNWNRPSDLE